MILVRPVEDRDLNDLYKLAAYLDSMNLPYDKKQLKTFINISIASFSNKIQSKQRGRFLFVAENSRSGKVVGCSAVYSQHGTQQRPHLYFQIHKEILKSHYLGKTVLRRYMTLEKKKNGPTEMCSLVVLPRYRRTKDKVGRLLTLARYMYVWNHPEHFKKEFLSELNGDIRVKDRGNDLWDALGAHLTGLDYHTADRLSVQSKEFVLSLYPKTKFYIDLLPYKAQHVIGKVGKSSVGAKKILEKLGLRYLNQCCPFDGGPHYGAKWNEIKPFKKMKKIKLKNKVSSSLKGLISVEFKNQFFVFNASKESLQSLCKKIGVKELSDLKVTLLKGG